MFEIYIYKESPEEVAIGSETNMEYLWYLEFDLKFQNPRTNPLGVKVKDYTEKEKEKITLLVVATRFVRQSS